MTLSAKAQRELSDSALRISEQQYRNYIDRATANELRSRGLADTPSNRYIISQELRYGRMSATAPPTSATATPADDMADVSRSVADLFADDTDASQEGSATASVIRDTYDDATYNHAKDDYPRLLSGELDATEKLTTAPDLLRDVFASFNQRAPMLSDPSKLTRAHQINREIIEEIMATEQHAELRANGTPNDALNSAIATIGTTEALVARMTEAERQNVNDLHAAETKAGQLDDLGDALDAKGDATGDASWHTKANRARGRAQQQRSRADQLAQQLQTHGQARRDAMRRTARKAMADAAQQMSQLQSAVEAFGGPGSGMGDGVSGLPLKDKIALARKLRASPKLARLAELVGRMKFLATALQNAKVDHSPTEIADIVTGNDLTQVLPGELVLLAEDDTEDMFYLRYIERSLLQYRLQGEDSIGKGPIICVTDESGSMTESIATEHGEGMTKELWSKAVAIALLAVARQQRRDFAWIHFASGTQVHTELFVKGAATPDQLIASADHFFNGGTEYEPWMAEALHLIDRSRFDRADVVLLSDGQAAVGDDLALAWARAQQTRHFRTFSVLISAHYEAGGGDVLESISDVVIPIKGIGDERAALRQVLSV